MSGIRSIPKSPDLLVMITVRISHVSQGVTKVQAPFPNTMFTDPDLPYVSKYREAISLFEPNRLWYFVSLLESCAHWHVCQMFTIESVVATAFQSSTIFALVSIVCL